LANVLERAQILAEDNMITLDDLPETITGGPSPSDDASASGPLNLRDLERRTVMAALEQAKGNKVHASKALGISRRALYRMIEAYGLAGREDPRVAGCFGRPVTG
jgi:transcriptional regulator of acetoin/glycerol metabolism